MSSDSLRIALISETLEAGSPQRRRAARILLELWRCDELSPGADRQVAAVREAAGAAVAAEARRLLEKLGLTSPEDRSSARPAE
jgi:hypothetical protein